MPVDLNLLKQRNAQRWLVMVVKPELINKIKAVTFRLTEPKAMARYAALSGRTGVPKEVIAVIHERESSQDWSASLAQGDPWNRRSVHEPKGRGPFNSWEDAGYDALMNCPPYAGKWKDWSAGGALTLLEQYNGLGYAGMGLPSPYVWASTNQYVSGKYIADHQFDPDVVDRQLGCAAILKEMDYLKPRVPDVPPPVQPKQEPISPIQKKGLVASLWDAIVQILKRGT